MNYSYEWYLEHLYDSILRDVVARYPDYRRGAERDKSRLLSSVKERGISVYTIDLPALGKALDRALSEGFLARSGLPLSRSAKRDHMIPRLFQGLYERIFHHDGYLRAQPDIVAVKLLRQLLYAAKKVRIDCGTSKTVKAVAEYFQVDREVELPSLDWDSDDFDAQDAGHLSVMDKRSCDTELPLFDRIQHDEVDSSDCPRDLLYDIQLVADVTASELGWFSGEDGTFRHGPGAVADQELYGNKYLFPVWPAKLERVFPVSSVGFSNFGSWADALSEPDVGYGLSSHEPPSVLISVPKTQKTPRLIAKETISHQWCQQSIRDFLDQGTSRISIGPSLTFKSQEPSREAARSASLTGDMSTIDLSAASDRVSCWLVERLFRRNLPLLQALHASRTRWIVNNIDKKSPRFHKLRKFSTMGSAVTFPLQSYIYTMVCVAAILRKEGRHVTSRNIRQAARMVRVFGDDIIVPSDVSATVIAALGHLGFKVNRDKTHQTGKFRESCGMDAFMGHDVTPAYVTQLPQQERPEALIAWVEICKNFFKKGLWYSSQWIESTGKRLSPLLRILPSAPKDSGAFAWPTEGYYEMPLRKKWSDKYQRWLYWTVVPKGRRATSPTQGSTGLLRYFTEDPSQDTFWSSEIGLRPRLLLKARWEPLLNYYQ